MIDVSDGLSTDLGHILEESQVGAEIDAERIPIAPAAHRLAERTGRDPLHHALHDGEDFELLFTLAARDAARIEGKILGGTRLTRIGRITRGPGAWLRKPNGDRVPLEPAGYQHRLGTS
jgi:thiamine-monophosphate kinase